MSVSTMLSRLLHLRRGPWENLTTIVIAAGVVMLMQPLALALYSYSFVTILAGRRCSSSSSHFPEISHGADPVEHLRKQFSDFRRRAGFDADGS